MSKTALRGEPTKDDFIYARIEKDLLAKVDILREAKGFKNRSQAVRCVISWSFDNGISDLQKPEKKKRQPKTEDVAGSDEVIYTRIENNLLTQIDSLQKSCELDNRSQTVRGIISWAFENGVQEA